MVELRYVLLTAFALIAVACAGSTLETPDAATTGGSALQMYYDNDVAELSTQLVAELGSDNAAMDALLLSLGQGYSNEQILLAATDRTLESDGAIAGVNPERAPLNFADAVEETEGAAGLGTPDEIVLAYAQPDSLFLERLRRGAAEAAKVNSANEDEVGRQGTTFILTLLKQGFVPADIVEIVILGLDGVVLTPTNPGTQLGRNAARLPPGCQMAIASASDLYCPNGERGTFGPADATESDAQAVPQSTAVPDARTDDRVDSLSDLNGTYRGNAQGADLREGNELSGELIAVFDSGTLGSFSGEVVEFTPGFTTEDGNERCELRLVLNVRSDPGEAEYSSDGFFLPVDIVVDEFDRCSYQSEADLTTYDLPGLSVRAQLDESGGLRIDFTSGGEPTGLYFDLSAG